MRPLHTALCLLFLLAACNQSTGSFVEPDANPPRPISDRNGHVVDNHVMAGGPGTNGGNPGGGGGPGGSGGGAGAPVPEPTTMLLLGTGLAGMAMLDRRRRRKSRDLASGEAAGS